VTFAHANSPRHLLWRLETMAMMSDIGLPVGHVRAQVASAIDVIAHMARLPNGRRVVLEVATIDGIHEEQPVLTPLFRFRLKGALIPIVALTRGFPLASFGWSGTRGPFP
jgi:pilus assembly protein CpaF